MGWNYTDDYKMKIKDITDWWNKGRNQRLPDEDTASWKDLAKDDWEQRQGRTGPGGKGGWDPTRGFRVMDAEKGGLKSGPTPAVRQAVERPLKLIKKLVK
jgi:hypothetical protein